MKAPSFIRRRFESILTQKDIPVNFLYSSHPSFDPLPENRNVRLSLKVKEEKEKGTKRKRGQIYFLLK